MTLYTNTDVPILYVPDQPVGLSEEGYNEFKAARDEGRDALYRASDTVRSASAALQRAQAAQEADSEDEAASEGLREAQEAFDAARAAQIEVEHKYLLIGHSVLIHNKDPRVGPEWTPVGIGASDLDEAIKEAIGAFDLGHIGEVGVSSDVEFKPDWVASSHPLLGKLLADYYDCEQRELAEVL
jgi:hypothetical protein